MTRLRRLRHDTFASLLNPNYRLYFAGQRQWHPDRFVNRPAEERARASTEAASLNDAYRTLKDPL